MDAGSVGFIVIFVLYASVGLLAAIGSVVIARKLFGPRAEQVFYAGFLVAIAAFYLAFTAYFGADAAWPLETWAVLGFAGLAVVGARLPMALIIGYALHGIWDGLHELQAHGVLNAFEPGRSTEVPLAYGAFCAMFDFCIAGYFWTRRNAWSAAWAGESHLVAV
jgi:hypothetical protein